MPFNHQGDRSDFNKALAEVRRQPRSDGEVPSDLFFRRKVRGHIIRQESESGNGQIINREKLKLNENISARELAKLSVGQIVRVRNQVSKTWERKAKIAEVCEFGRSYELLGLDDEVKFRRNRKFLKPVNDDKTASEAVDRPSYPGPGPMRNATESSGKVIKTD